MINGKNYDIINTFVQNKFAVFITFMFTILVPIYSYFSKLDTTMLFLYVLSLLFVNIFINWVMLSWLRRIGGLNDKLLAVHDGRLHLLLSCSRVVLECSEESLETEEPVYRSFGFTVAILNERDDFSDVEFIINKPPQVAMHFDFDKMTSCQIIMETTNQIQIKMNINKGVFLLPIQLIEISSNNINSFMGSNKFISFEIKSENFRNIPREKMCTNVHVGVNISG